MFKESDISAYRDPWIKSPSLLGQGKSNHLGQWGGRLRWGWIQISLVSKGSRNLSESSDNCSDSRICTQIIAWNLVLNSAGEEFGGGVSMGVGEADFAQACYYSGLEFLDSLNQIVLFFSLVWISVGLVGSPELGTIPWRWERCTTSFKQLRTWQQKATIP
jgi:hypothetical protein